VAVGRDLARRQEVRDDAGDVRGSPDIADRVGCGDLERRRSRLERGAREDHDQRGRGRTQLGLEERLGARRFEVVEDEPAGAELAGDLRRERERDQQQGGPRADDPPRSMHDEAAEPLEGRSRLGFASDSTTDEERTHRTRDGSETTFAGSAFC
jgi:hypothetical protein